MDANSGRIRMRRDVTSFPSLRCHTPQSFRFVPLPAARVPHAASALSNVAPVCIITALFPLLRRARVLLRLKPASFPSSLVPANFLPNFLSQRAATRPAYFSCVRSATLSDCFSCRPYSLGQGSARLYSARVHLPRCRAVIHRVPILLLT